MRGRRVSYIISALISLAIGVLAYMSRHEISAAFTTLQTAEPLWLVAAMATIALSYLLSAQVFAVALRSLGHRMSIFRLWGAALTAIVMS
jgi:uncharacterized membrane protein YbhN (UPF0104 family)